MNEEHWDEDLDHYDDYLDYDFRTYNEKVHDDNTWQKNRGILKFDGVPFLQWCPTCKKVVEVIDIEGSTVFDRYNYIVCAVCDTHENQGLRDPTEEELDEHDKTKHDGKGDT